MSRVLAGTLAAAVLIFGIAARGRNTPRRSGKTPSRPALQITFEGTKDGGTQEQKPRPLKSIILRLRNITRFRIDSLGQGECRIYALVSDDSKRQSMPATYCGGCGDVAGLVSIAPRGTALIFIAPEDLKPGYAIRMVYWTLPRSVSEAAYFGYSDLPKAIQNRIGLAHLKSCAHPFDELLPPPPDVVPQPPEFLKAPIPTLPPLKPNGSRDDAHN